MFARFRSCRQVERAFADADAVAKTTAVEDTPLAAKPPEKPLEVPPSPPIRPQAMPRGKGGGTFDLLGDDDDGLELLSPPQPLERPADDVAVSISVDGRGSLAPAEDNPDVVAAAGDVSLDGSAFDDLCSDDGLGSDDDTRNDDAVGLSGGGSVVAVATAGGIDDPEDEAAAAVTPDLPDLRMMTDSPSPDHKGRRRIGGGGPSGGGATSARLALGERLAAARSKTESGAAADAAVAESPRAFSGRRLGVAGARASTPGYRGSARKSGVRTAVDRETQFLGTQM